MDYVIDLIVAGIILLTVFTSARRGFVRIVVETVGFILAIVITFTIHTPLANMTYDTIIAPAIRQAVSETANGTAEEMTDRIWEKLPSFVKENAVFPDVTEKALSKTVNSSLTLGKNTAQQVSDHLIRPTAVGILSLLYSVLLMAVFMIAVRFVASALNRLFSFRLAGRINTALGAAVGIVRGMIVAVIFCLVISLLVSFTKSGFWIFTPETLERSRFMAALAEFYPMAGNFYR